jgi:hypothetical protein
MQEELERLESEYYKSARATRSALGLRDAADLLLTSVRDLEGFALDALHAHQDKMNKEILERDFHRNG